MIRMVDKPKKKPGEEDELDPDAVDALVDGEEVAEDEEWEDGAVEDPDEDF